MSRDGAHDRDDQNDGAGQQVADRAAMIEAQWRRERPDLDPSSIGVITRIWHLGKVFSANRRELLARLGIDTALMDLLGTLRRSGEPYRLSTRELADASVVSAAAISQRLARAEQRGWVRREPRPGRRVDVQLTEEGRRITDEFAGAIFVSDEAMLDGLSSEDRAELTRLLAVLSSSLIEATQRPLSTD
ncbi:MAG: MarR family transcriptional regulator [Actinomycetales bacterium]|nr:MarR family transcriptional regulator [Actinomycetales bacterium]